MNCLSIFLIPSRSSNTPFYPLKCCEPGIAPQFLFIPLSLPLGFQLSPSRSLGVRQKLCSKPKIEYFTIYMKRLIIMFKWKPSSLTYAIILFLKSYSFKKSIKFFANECHAILKASNKSIITCFGSQSCSLIIITREKHYEHPLTSRD